MRDNIELSTCEKMIMVVICKADTDLNLYEVTERVAQRFGKVWKLQTVATFVKRMEKKGFLYIYKVGRYSYYRPIISLDEMLLRFEFVNLCNIYFDCNREKMLEYIMAEVV